MLIRSSVPRMDRAGLDYQYGGRFQRKSKPKLSDCTHPLKQNIFFGEKMYGLKYSAGSQKYQCPGCRKWFDFDYFVEHHKQYLPIEITTYICRKCHAGIHKTGIPSGRESYLKKLREARKIRLELRRQTEFIKVVDRVCVQHSRKIERRRKSRRRFNSWGAIR